MKQLPVLQQRRFHFITYLVVVALILLTALAGAQTSSPDSSSSIQPEDLQKYTALFTKLGELVKKIQANVHYPTARSESRLLPLLPASTIAYVAIPNYGEASHQILDLLQQELKDNAELHNVWTNGAMAAEGTKVEDAVTKFYQVSQYLGDEIVFSVAVEEGRKDPGFLMLAEVHEEVQKPGLKDFLQGMLKELAGNSKQDIRVFDVPGLSSAKELAKPASGEFEILVRPDYVVAASDLETLRKFNASLDHKSHDFAATSFGQRMTQAYEGGATLLAGADLQSILRKSPVDTFLTLHRTGFGDMKYLVWKHIHVDGQSASQMELSFTGPRHGVASWLAAPGAMPSLDFVSPKAMVVTSFLLKNPAQMFDDYRELATASNPKALDGLSQMEQAMKVSLRDDLFSRLGGEIALELDSLSSQERVWKVVLKVKDPDGLQTTLNTLMAAAHIDSQPGEEDGVTYHTIPIPSAQPIEVGYAFVDGYLVIASSRETAADAVRLHRSGESLAKSKQFLAALPPGNLAEVSALFYEDPIALAMLSMQQTSPAMSALFSQSSAEHTPVLMAAYGDESAIREASRSGGADAGAMMVIAAVAIPNLLRARIAANESSAVGSIRTANTAEVTYAAIYPQRGFARDLATLGPDPSGSNTPSPQHARLIDPVLSGASCTANAWCEKSGYSFRITSACAQSPCKNYVIVATPVSSNSGTRSFCSTSDAVIRSQAGPIPSGAFTASQCRKWPPLQ